MDSAPHRVTFGVIILGHCKSRVKIYGEDVDTLKRPAETVARIGRGAADVKVEQITGLPLLSVRLRRGDMARYGISVDDAQRVIQTAIAGTTVSRVIEGDRRFDLTVRLTPEARRDEEDIGSFVEAVRAADTIRLV